MNSKRKGAVGEREIAAYLREHGFDAHRGQQYKGSPDSPDVTGLDGFHIEVKRVERLNIYQALAQAVRDCGNKIPIVIHRRNRDEWKVTMPQRIRYWMHLFRGARSRTLRVRPFSITA